MKVSELAERIGATVVGDGEREVTACGTLESAGAGQLSFLANPRYVRQLETTSAGAVVAGLNVTSERVTLLRAKDPYYAFTQALVILHGYRKHPHAGIHPAAHVDPTATVGENTIMYPGVYIGPRAKVGRDCILYPNAVIYDDCVLGDRVTVHAGAAIGMDGFGYATHPVAQPDGTRVAVHTKIPQTGNVVLEDDVEIGANCAIQRATMGSTVIGRGTKFGDLINIGHGTKIGAHGLFVGLIGVAGSATIGHHATLGGQAGVAGHLKVGDNVTIAGQAGVMNNIQDQTTVIGVPAMDAAHARKVYLNFMQLPELVQRIKQLEHRIEELGAEPGDDGTKPE
ncbi:MAG TPA: UDP-3-O-(3-hydroxymyristoyl)glucosamine N-acyltransferase [Tepidisphaeraceae bacterium]|nr:UDP-3-O-(3-hydroxymyristoyl)glucosamine N-acyltransferase [Tepidisphaeraceae bacterium]